MSVSPTQTPSDAARQVRFLTTHWSAVLAAGRADTAGTDARRALDKLCGSYWYPLYAYVRRCGHSPPDAQDLTQEFFARMLAFNWLAQADPARGRFRTFLLMALKRFLANEWDRLHAQKRGGGQPPVPLELDQAETRYRAEPADTRTPDQVFERRWAMLLLEEVLRRLETEERARGKAEEFMLLKPSLQGRGSSLPYEELARQLGTSESAVKVAVHRLRSRYRELLRAEIAQTVASAEEVDAEMRHLFRVLLKA